jgi:hypothetical protein
VPIGSESSPEINGGPGAPLARSIPLVLTQSRTETPRNFLGPASVMLEVLNLALMHLGRFT